MSLRLPRLGSDPESPFPATASALAEPDGLLAFGGDLSPTRLRRAYRLGIFPWFAQGEPILWWSPALRAGFDTGGMRLARRLRRDLKDSTWTLSADSAFEAVIRSCADVPRRGQLGTWITPEMQRAYLTLHHEGEAHSVEVHADGHLIGGIYGVQAGAVFCGESMFSRVPGASKVALAALCRALHAWGVDWLDAQVPNPHLALLGARAIDRATFLNRLSAPPATRLPAGDWRAAFPLCRAAELA